MAMIRGIASFAAFPLLIAMLTAGCNNPESYETQPGKKAGAQAPQPGGKARSQALETGRKAGVQALKILRKEYGLPEPPPFKLKVWKAKESATGSFRLVVGEPGWEADSPLEPADIKTETSQSSTVFTWELPATRVVSHLNRLQTRPLLLHLWKGQDHRPVVLPCFETSLSGSEWGWWIFGGPIVVVSAPLWVPYGLVIGGLEKAKTEMQLQDLTWPQPGEDAPECYPEGATTFSTHLRPDPLGKPHLVITVAGSAWNPCESTALDSMRRSIGYFQPELAAGITEDPTLPNTFIVPLSTTLSDRSRPILLVHRDCTTKEEPEGSLWALYFSSKRDWVKAWRIFPADVPFRLKSAQNLKEDTAH